MSRRIGMVEPVEVIEPVEKEIKVADDKKSAASKDKKEKSE